MNVRNYLLVSLLSLLGFQLMGQTLTLDSPVSRMVFQRSSSNTAIVPVRGQAPGSATRIQGRLIARQGGQTTDWREGSLSNGTFQINISATGGFYDLEVVALAGNTEVARQRRERIGVGEVFIVSGQSNNYGEEGKGLPAADDRVSVVNYWPGLEGHVSESTLPMVFSQAGPGTNCAPRNPLYIWGGLGDRLVAKLGVPVLFLGAAGPGASTNNWREAAQGVENVSGRDWTGNIPYKPLRLALQVYGKKTGIRGILWHQGESDNSFQTTEGYVNNMRVVIGQTRNDSGFGNLSWMIARASYYPFYPGKEVDPNIITAQNILIGSTSNTFAGPYTDPYYGPNYRADKLHFTENAYGFLADLWSSSLTTDYFRQSQPSLPNYGPASPAASNQTDPVAQTPTTPDPSKENVGNALRLTTPTYNCQTGAIVLNTSGGDGTRIEFAIPGITGWTTNPAHTVGEGIRRDAQTLTIYARQSGGQISLIWGIRAACDGSAPTTSPGTTPSTGQPASNTAPQTPAPPITGGALALQTPLYNCQTGAAVFRTTGGNGSAVEFMAPGITGWTTNASHLIGEGIRRDAQTITIYARQSGVQISLNWNIRAACDGSAPATPPSTTTPPTSDSAPKPSTPPASIDLILLVPIYNCGSGQVTFSTIGGTGSVVEYMAPGITGWTTTPTHVIGEGIRRDAQTITIYARQNGKQVSLVWNIRSACTGGSMSGTSARMAPAAEPTMEWVVGPNPTTDEVQLLWPGAANATWSSRVLSASGYELKVAAPETTPTGLRLNLRQLPTGIYLWQVTPQGSPTQTFKIMKLD
ncbi:hypothetical protein F5984_00330 [Rudanella paleaurantiibacter]|uniref:Sialate O-acetylesterase domain-containing protein n=2 Tax=Rudanella paleaurantiibacter TaxID=2614655 RepID=A0A7J5U3M4_9BACT|nr:hypothetical protein F5984_00330 [Rudanella paleaurantiibacter]